MTTDRGALAALLATMTVLAATATPAAAQTEPAAPVRGLERLQTPGTQGNPDATAIPVPAAPTIVLPNTTPAPRRTARSRDAAKPAADRATAKRAGVDRTTTEAPTRERATTRTTPDPTTRPRTSDVEPTRSSMSVESAPVATPTPEPARPSSPSQTPATEAAPQSSAPQPTAPTPAPAAESTLSTPEKGSAMPLWLSLTAIVVVLGALWALRRKPRSHRYESVEPEVVEPTPPPVAAKPVAQPIAPQPVAPRPVVSEPAETLAAVTPATASAIAPVAAVPMAAPKFLEPKGKVPPTPPVAARARLTCELRPLRAGLNLLSATVECEFIVTNTGTASAEAIRTGVVLLTAHADQDQDLAQFNAAPVMRPVAPPFALAPGETRTIRTVTAIAREAIRTMTAANRPMFVPVVASNILYVTAGDEAQTARAWVVGIERVDSAKLAPFWLDAPARMYTTVAARPHAVTFDR